jgi:PadR family transcriptional regulator, regulatory protein PadR
MTLDSRLGDPGFGPSLTVVHLTRGHAARVACLPVKVDIVRGHLDALLLASLEDGPLHGYAIIEALQARSGGVLDLPTGSVYPALRRLERARYVSGRWGMVGGRRRRTYQLTRAGRQALARERADWTRFTSAIGGVLRGGQA